MIVGLTSCRLVYERNYRLRWVGKVQFHFPGKLLGFDLLLKNPGE
jgi:hypothetical protein